MAKIPDVSGLLEKDATEKLEALGLVVERREVSSTTVNAGTAIGTEPKPDVDFAPGDRIILDISSGPAPDVLVAVPDLSGLTVPASRRVLESFGLKQGKYTRQYSDLMPKGAVLSSTPATGEMVPAGSIVAVEISDGPKVRWAEYIVPVVVAILGLIVVLSILWVLLKGGGFLAQIADKNVARGLITFLIAISTVGIAFILAVSTMVSPQTGDDAGRFDRGKQVLSILIGVLGTIVGFYFGSAPDAPAQQPQTQEEAAPNPSAAGAVGQAYAQPVISTEGLVAPIVWSADPELPRALSMSATGELSGTPTAAYPRTTVAITGRDSSDPPKTVEATIELEIR